MLGFNEIFDTRIYQKLIKVEIRMTTENCLKVLFSQFQFSKIFRNFIGHFLSTWLSSDMNSHYESYDMSHQSEFNALDKKEFPQVWITIKNRAR